MSKQEAVDLKNKLKKIEEEKELELKKLMKKKNQNLKGQKKKRRIKF